MTSTGNKVERYMKKRSMTIRIAVFVVLLVVFAGMAFQRYTSDYYSAKGYEVQVKEYEDTEDYTVYGDVSSSVGFIFYPGAKVDEAAYAPIMDELAEAGICCVVAKMPYHMAILDTDAAESLMEQFPKIEHWYLGGHSLGGAMAAGFAAKHSSELEGLILLAAYPTKELTELPVLSIYGSEDMVLNREKYAESIVLAKELTERVIEGGNHAGFGDYGVQDGDGTAEITSEEQWQETVDYVMNFMASNNDNAE